MEPLENIVELRTVHVNARFVLFVSAEVQGRECSRAAVHRSRRLHVPGSDDANIYYQHGVGRGLARRYQACPTRSCMRQPLSEHERAVGG